MREEFALAIAFALPLVGFVLWVFSQLEEWGERYIFTWQEAITLIEGSQCLHDGRNEDGWDVISNDHVTIQYRCHGQNEYVRVIDPQRRALEAHFVAERPVSMLQEGKALPAKWDGNGRRAYEALLVARRARVA